MVRDALLQRLHAIARTTRRRLVAFGVCTVAAGGCASLLTIITLDWLLRFPPAVRVIADVLFVGGFLLATWHWIVRAWRERVGLAEVAEQLEARFPELRDRLASTVAFLQHGPRGSTTLTESLVERTSVAARSMPFERILTLKPLLHRLAVLVLAGSALLFIAFSTPDWLRVGSARYALPFGAVEWPKQVELVSLTGHQRVALGESTTLRMRIVRGQTSKVRPMVHLREADGHVAVLALQEESPGEFTASIDAITTDLEYWFTAGDDSTAWQPFSIRAVRRPEVAEILANVYPPAYAPPQPPRLHDLRDGPLSAVVGSRVAVEVRPSKRIDLEEVEAAAALHFADGDRIPLTPAPEVPNDGTTRLIAELPVEADRSFTVHLVDAEGFASRTGSPYIIRATADQPPRVQIVEPRSVVEITARGAIPLVIQAQDDFGLTALELMGEVPEAAITTRLPLSEQLAPQQGEDEVRAVVETVWQLGSLGLSPGQSIQYHVEGWDNRQTPMQTAQVGRSAVLTARVISEAEFDGRLRDELTLLERRLRRALLEQTGLLDQSAGWRSTEADPQPLSRAEREAAANAASEQARLARRLEQAAERFDELAERMRLNEAGTEEDRQQLAASASSLRQAAQQDVRPAARQLADLAEQDDPADQQKQLAEAQARQQQALERITALIENMAQWGDFQAVVSRTRDLLERQQSLRAETAKLGQSLLGKSVEDLTAEQAAALAQLRHQQDQLRADLDQLLTRMDQLARVAGEDDPSAEAALESAQRQAQANDVARRLEAASEALQENRTAAANLEQRRAEQALNRMVDALREREDRELELLVKNLDRAEAELKRRIEEQQALRAVTAELVGRDAAAERFIELADEQYRLGRNTQAFGLEVAAIEQVFTAARLVQQAGRSMEQAADVVRTQDAGRALAPQDEALALLQQALDDIVDLAQASEERALKRSLARVREQLVELLALQQEIQTGVADLREQIGDSGRLRRRQSRLATQLARQQSESLAAVATLRPLLEQVVVYDWALARAIQWMEQVRERLEQRSVDDALVLLTGRIVRELEQLIQAIDDTQSLPMPDKYVEESGGGGGGGAMGGGMDGPPVPTLAELLVLKAMQQDINTRTGELAAILEEEAPTEKQLQALKILGEDQEQVRELTERVTQRARGR
jgi:hypothetical protein